MTLSSALKQDVAFKNLTFSGCKGIMINALHFANAQATHNLIIAPGRAESAQKYQELAQQFHALGYEVAVIDHRGQGQSERFFDNPQLGHMDDFEYCVDDMVKLNTLLPERPLVIVAHSMGGAITARLLERYPQLCSGAVLCSPMLSLHLPKWLVGPIIFSKAWWEQRRFHKRQRPPGYVLPIVYGPYRSAPFSTNVLTGDKTRYQQCCALYEQHPELSLGGPTAGWVANAYRLMTRVLRHADQIRIPVLVISAGSDRVVSAKGQTAFCRALGDNSVTGPEPLVIPTGKHELWQERAALRDQVWQATTDYLQHHVQQPQQQVEAATPSSEECAINNQ